MSVPYLSLVRLPVRPSWYLFVWWVGGVWQKSKIAYDHCLTRGFLDHFWYGVSISELHLASIPWEHLHFASRIGDFRPVEGTLWCTKRDWSRQNHMKWTSEMNSSSQNYSRTSCVWLLRLRFNQNCPSCNARFGNWFFVEFSSTLDPAVH